MRQFLMIFKIKSDLLIVLKQTCFIFINCHSVFTTKSFTTTWTFGPHCVIVLQIEFTVITTLFISRIIKWLKECKKLSTRLVIYLHCEYIKFTNLCNTKFNFVQAFCQISKKGRAEDWNRG